MKVTSVCRYFVLILILQTSSQIDLLAAIQKRNSDLLKYASPLFEREKLKTALRNKENEVSLECYNDMQLLLAKENYNESVQFFDAWSSLPNGLLYGYEQVLGNFDECQEARIVAKGSDENIQGRYTRFKAFLKSTKVFSFIELFPFDVCLPNRCSNGDIHSILKRNFASPKTFFSLFNKFINDSHLESYQIYFSIQMNEKDISKDDRFAANIGVIIFSLILALVMLSSMYELITMQTNGKQHPLLRSFSIFTNIKLLFQTKTKSLESSNIISCVDGIRSLSLIWNIFGHTYMWSRGRSDLNRNKLLKVLDTFFGRILITANFSVDVFLLLSGLLVTWLGLNRMRRSRRQINIKMMYLHRYLRLIPAFAATILFASGLYIFVGNGPLWYNYALTLSKQCQDNWWVSLLFITNYFRIEHQCLGYSWFLAVDIQLFIFSPFILRGLWKWPRKMVGILLSLIIFSCFYHYSAVMSLGQNDFIYDNIVDNAGTEFLTIFYETQYRMAFWLIGVLLGYIIYQYRNKPPQLSRITVLFGWFVALLVMTLVIFGSQPLHGNRIQPGPLQSALYESLGRSCFIISLAWIIFSCYMGYSQLINAFLSHEIWQIIAKLNYTIFLVKYFINVNTIGLQKTSQYFSYYNLISEFWTDFGISATAAIVLSLSVELPFISISNYFEKALVPF